MDGSPHMLYRDFRMVSIRTGICLLDFWLLPVKMRVCGKRRSARSRQEYEFLFVLIWICPDEPDEGRFSFPFSILWLGHGFSLVGSNEPLKR